MTPPDRSREQRLAALAEANRIRTARARLKVALGRDRALLERVIARDVDGLNQAAGLELRPHDLDTMRLLDALIAAPKLGRIKANRLLAGERISPSKTLGGLSARQRRELLIALGFARRLDEYVTAVDLVDVDSYAQDQPDNGRGGHR